MNVSKNAFYSIEQVTDRYLDKNSTQTGQKEVNHDGYSFREVLEMKESLVFSKHAKNRLTERSIDLTESQLRRLQEGADKAGEKGIKESLVLVDDLAFIVNIKNNTVITAMDKSESSENIFTNIDGAVIS